MDTLLSLVDPMSDDGLALLLVLYSRANSGITATLSESALERIGIHGVEVATYLSAPDPLAYLLERADP